MAKGLKKGDVSTSAPVTPGFLGHLQAFNLRHTRRISVRAHRARTLAINDFTPAELTGMTLTTRENFSGMVSARFA